MYRGLFTLHKLVMLKAKNHEMMHRVIYCAGFVKNYKIFQYLRPIEGAADERLDYVTRSI